MADMNTAGKVIAGWRALIVVVVMACAGCVVLDPRGEVNGLMAEGQQLYSAQRFDEAIARFHAAAARDPGNYAAHAWLARAFMARGAWPDAVISARKAFELSRGAPDVMPVLLEALLGGGNDALARGSFVESIGYLGEYLRHQPTNIRAWITVGRAYAGNRQFMDALGALRKALEMGTAGPERTEALQSMLGLGRQALNDRDYGSAINLLREYVKFNSNDWSAYLELGKAYLQSGSLRDALGAFGKVLELNPRNAEALKFLQSR